MAFKAEDIEDAPRVHTASSLPSSSPTRSPSHPSPHGILGRLRSYESYLDAKLGIETQGSERVLPHERQPPATWVMFAMWASATMNLSCFATGFLGLQFGLDLAQSIPIVVCASFLGACITGWCATLGAPTGLRQVSISRYSFGWWPSKLVAFLNVVEQLGWSSVGCITGGLALTAVSDGRVSLVLGVVIIAVVGLVFSFVGLKAVMQYEQFAWMVFFVIFMVMYGEAAPKADAQLKSELSGLTLSGTVLNLLAVVYGSSASWSSIVSDYYVQYPVNTSKHKVFWLTTLGITIPTCIGMILGCCVASTIQTNKEWSDAYDQGLGYLVQTILYPRGFAKFILVLLVLSGIGTNCIAIYSASLSITQFARPLAIIPRSLYTIPVFVGILLLGLAGRDHLLSVLENFLSLLGYWNTAFFAILFTEHYLFRHGQVDRYDLEGWNDPSRLPLGIAGGLAFAVGIVGGVLGMTQTWYVGVVAKLIGDAGGDVGNELALVMTLCTYVPARWAERKYLGR